MGHRVGAPIFFMQMTPCCRLWKTAAWLAAASILFTACHRPAPRATEQTAEPSSLATSVSPLTQENSPVTWLEDSAATAAVKESAAQTPPSQAEAMSPATIEAESQLRATLTQYRTGDEATRSDIEEHLSQLLDAGVPREEIVSALGAMFAMENSAAVKSSILDELYYIDDPSVLEQVRLGLSPDQPLNVRDEAIYVLRDIGDNRAIRALWPYLSDPDINIREEAQEAIDAIMLRGGGKPH